VSESASDQHAPVTVLESVVKRLQTLVADTLPPGAQMPTEAELSTRFGVSRATVREALKVLAGIGVLDMGRGRKTVVRAPSPSVLAGNLAVVVRRDPRRVLELAEIQDALNLLAATLAATHGRRHLDSLAVAEDYLTRMEQADDRKMFAEANAGFHRALEIATENEMLGYLLDAIEQVLEEVAETGFESRLNPTYSSSPEGAVAVHRAVLEAVHSEDERLAESAMKSHATEMRSDMRARVRALLARPTSS
jgi:GntR family transcriptional regulator, transcriptional repressor for pyruvate dehydrogenase complex